MPKTGQKIGRSFLVPSGVPKYPGTFMKVTKKGYHQYKTKKLIDSEEFRGHYYG